MGNYIISGSFVFQVCQEGSEQGQDVTGPPFQRELLSLAAAWRGMAAWEEGNTKTGEEICSSEGRRCWELGLGAVAGMGGGSDR